MATKHAIDRKRRALAAAKARRAAWADGSMQLKEEFAGEEIDVEAKIALCDLEIEVLETRLRMITS
jgi:hypothetical protein